MFIYLFPDPGKIFRWTLYIFGRKVFFEFFVRKKKSSQLVISFNFLASEF